MTIEAKTKRARRGGRRERERKRLQLMASLDRDASMLPTEGPIADLVKAISTGLRLRIAAGYGLDDRTDGLRHFGEQAFQLTGSARGVRAVAHKAAGLDLGYEALRQDMLKTAWRGIGDHADTLVA